MAKKFDNDFDSVAFVDNFRVTEGPPTSPETNLGIESSAAPHMKERVTITKNKKDRPSDSADDYQAIFIDELKYRFPDYGWPQVKIHPDFKVMISTLENLCRSRRANLSTFINNVLEQHFRDYEAQIKELKKKYNEDE